MQDLPIVNGRNCEGCTKCCEGQLVVDIRGVTVDRKPCPFVTVGVGCVIYNDEDIRNDSICSKYRCDYLTDLNIPEEFKPSLSDFIIETYLSSDKGRYLRIIQSGDNPNMKVLEWARNLGVDAFARTINEDGTWLFEYMGSQEFIDSLRTIKESKE